MINFILQLVVVKKLPSRALTRIWGRITRIHLAPWARTPLLGVFCAMFGVRAEEAERGSLREFSSLHSFFTRTLKEELRPICPEHSVVSSSGTTCPVTELHTHTHAVVFALCCM